MEQFLKIWSTNSPLLSDTMALKKNSPYKIFFNKGIQNMIDNGELQLYKQRNSKLTIIDCNLLPEGGVSLGFHKMASIFTILLFGTILGALFLFYECFRKPKKIANSFSKEKMHLLYNEFAALIDNFKKTNIQELRKKCQVPDSRFCESSGSKNCKTISIYTRIPKQIPELPYINE